ncbi:6-hydroxynicotinate 3-monooxygenase [Paramyrothecium foliicola]|nr:6-hydroxynicotinate 3-monooxygenase [Paramyrothecium foliicola]
MGQRLLISGLRADLTVLHIDLDNKELHVVANYPGPYNVSWVEPSTSHGQLDRLIGLSEGVESGLLYTFEIDHDHQTFRFTSQNTTLAEPAHFILLRDMSALALATYSGSSIALYPVSNDDENGLLLTDAQRSELLPDFPYKSIGHGPNKVRQGQCHVHQILEDSRGLLYAPDLGSDRVWIISRDRMRMEIGGWLQCPPGTGPRHAVFSPDKKLLYVVGELSHIVFAFDLPASPAKHVQPIKGFAACTIPPTVNPDHQSAMQSAEICVHPKIPNVLYVSNRWERHIAERGPHVDKVPTTLPPGDAIAILLLSEDGKEVQEIKFVRTKLDVIRGMRLSYDGRYVVVVGQLGGGVEVYGIGGNRGDIWTLTTSLSDGLEDGIKHAVIIIGAGPAGLMAALRLRQSNDISPAIYEIRDAPTTLGGSLGIPANGLRLLHELDLYDDMLSKGAPTSSLVIHGLDGSTLGNWDLASWSEQQTGFGYLRIRRADILDVLLRAAEREKIPIHFGKALTSIEEREDHVTAHFADGTSDTSDFLLGCDGIHSTVRQKHVDPEMKPQYTGFSNMFSLVPMDGLRFNPKLISGLNMTLTSNGMFALSPTTPIDNLVYWFFSREVPLPDGDNSRHGWEERGRREVENYRGLLLDLFTQEGSEWINLLRQVIKTTDTVKFYPIYKLPSGGQWFKGRCLLIGDAAHAMPPHASQGLSMALEDVFLFSKMLKTESLNLHDGLSAFTEKRKLRINTMLEKTERNGSIRRQTTPWRLRANELAISCGLWVYKKTGMDRLGFGQKSLLYKVEDEEF